MSEVLYEDIRVRYTYSFLFKHLTDIYKEWAVDEVFVNEKGFHRVASRRVVAFGISYCKKVSMREDSRKFGIRYRGRVYRFSLLFRNSRLYQRKHGKRLRHGRELVCDCFFLECCVLIRSIPVE